MEEGLTRGLTDVIDCVCPLALQLSNLVDVLRLRLVLLLLRWSLCGAILDLSHSVVSSGCESHCLIIKQIIISNLFTP